MKSKTKISGFTLLEIIIVITLTSILMVTIFQALDRVRKNESKLQEQRNYERDVYFLFNRLSDLFKSISSFDVFNSREQSPYFRGGSKDMVFLSRTPLVSPFGGVYFVQLQFADQKVYYREKAFRGRGIEEFVSFDELEGNAFYTILEDVEDLQFQYFLWDSGVGDFVWKREVNSFEKDPLPLRVRLRMLYEGKVYDLVFLKAIIDENEEIPAQLFR